MFLFCSEQFGLDCPKFLEKEATYLQKSQADQKQRPWGHSTLTCRTGPKHDPAAPEVSTFLWEAGIQEGFLSLQGDLLPSAC